MKYFTAIDCCKPGKILNVIFVLLAHSQEDAMGSRVSYDSVSVCLQNEHGSSVLVRSLFVEEVAQVTPLISIGKTLR